MRNLKRALSLALAAAMLISLMVVGASAASYNDQDAVSQAEAVQLLTDLGIVGGDQNGNFNPTATLTRAEFTVMMSNLLNGSKFDTTLFDGTDTPFTDVQGHWAAPYIAYCYSAGVIAGTSATTFSPDATLTSAQAAAILLMALGYNQANEFAANNQFALNVTAIAQREGLYQDLSVAANSGVSRENVAQMIKNALFMPMKEYLSVLQIYQNVQVNNQDATLARTQFDNPIRVTASVTGIDRDGNATLNGGKSSNETLVTGTAAQGLYNSELPATIDMVGNTVVFYVEPGATSANPTKVTTAFVVAGSNTLYTLNGKFEDYAAGASTLAALFSGNDKVASLDNDLTTSTVAIYYNGVSKTNDATTIGKIGNRGVEVKLNDTDSDGNVDTIIITEKSVATLTAAPTVTTTNGQTYVTIPAAGVNNKAAADVIGYQGLAKDDVILYVTLGTKTYLEKADVITGTVTGNHTTKGALINGSYYEASQVPGTTYMAGSITDTRTYNFYLDNVGNIVKASVVEDGSASNYVAVADIVWVKPGTDGSIGSSSDSYAEAKLVFTNGTSEIVTIDSIDGFEFVAEGGRIEDLVSGNDDTHYVSDSTAAGAEAKIDVGDSGTEITSTTTAGNYYIILKDNDGTVDANTQVLGRFVTVTDTAGTGVSVVPENAFYTYTVKSNGHYELSTDAKSNDSYGNLTAAVITNNTAVFNNSITGNANTVFIYATKDGDNNDVYTVYTGIANMPTTTGNITAANRAVVLNSAGVATYVFVNVPGTQAASDDVVYITSNNCTTVNADTPYYIYDAVVNGVATTINVDASGKTVGFYSVTKIVDDVYTLGASAGTNETGIKSVDGGVLVTSTASHIYDAGTPAYVISKSGNSTICTATTVESLTIDATDAVEIYNNEAGTKVESVYVVKVDEAPTALTLAKGSSGSLNVTASDLLNGATVTGWAAATDNLKVSAATAKANTTIVALTINGENAMSQAEVAIPETGSYDVVVTVEDDFSGALTSYTYTFTVS